MIGADEIKRNERAGYEAVAEAFDNRLAQYTGRFAADLIDLMSPQEGEVALDIAGGTGAAGLKLAERLGPKGSMVITDLTPAMLDHAQKHARGKGPGRLFPSSGPGPVPGLAAEALSSGDPPGEELHGGGGHLPVRQGGAPLGSG